MIIKVNEYKYEKILKEEIPIYIPEQAEFFQTYNYRVIYGIFPQKASWDNDKIYSLTIVCLTDNKIIKTSMNFSDIESILLYKNKEKQTFEDTIKYEILNYLRDKEKYENTTSIQYKVKLDNFTNSLNIIL